MGRMRITSTKNQTAVGSMLTTNEDTRVGAAMRDAMKDVMKDAIVTETGTIGKERIAESVEKETDTLRGIKGMKKQEAVAGMIIGIITGTGERGLGIGIRAGEEIERIGTQKGTIKIKEGPGPDPNRTVDNTTAKIINILMMNEPGMNQ